MTDFDARYEALRGRFLLRCREDLRHLREETDPLKLRPVVHRLAGAAGTFGFPDVSADAGALDDALIEGRDLPEDVRARLISTLQVLTQDEGSS